MSSAFNCTAETIPPTKITLVSVDDSQPTKGSVKLAPPAPIDTQARVEPLIEGVMYPTENGYFMTGSVTFISDQGYFIVVDSPSATDNVAKDQMFKGLNALGVVPSQIHIAVTTHGHPDHFGQGNFFSSAKHFFGPYVYSGGVFTRTELFQKNEIQLTKNVELWNTPGHTNQDVSVIVRNVAGYGTVAVVGDLFYSEIDALSDSQDWQRDALDGRLGIENRRRVLCAADAIVPGHAKIFRVTPEMRSRNGCPQALSITGSLNDLGTFRSEPSVSRQRENPTLETILQPTTITLPPALQPKANISAILQSRLYAAETLSNTVPLPTEPQHPVVSSSIPISLSIQPHPAYANQQQTLPVASQQPLLNTETIQSLQQSILLPLLESTAANLANYLTAAQGGVPVPQLASSQVRTTYPTLYQNQLQMLHTTLAIGVQQALLLLAIPAVFCSSNENSRISALICIHTPTEIPSSLVKCLLNQIVCLFNVRFTTFVGHQS
ncbi:Lactamase-B domain-containing protein [Aphelenchoides bicaudatus]|nr:Lactamase-B domain-containing protein [Aphelenchoides bicaudatus]